MENEKSSYNSIDEYIGSFPSEVQKKLEELRALVKSITPDAIEKISYQMPAFTLNGILLYFAAFKNHIGFYPVASGMAAFKDELKANKTGKGSIQFPLSEPLPIELISRIVRYRVDENRKKPKDKMTAGYGKNMNFNTILFDFDDTLLDRKSSLSVFIERFASKYNNVLICDDYAKFKDNFFDLDCSGYKSRTVMFEELLSKTEWISKPDAKELLDFWYNEFPKCSIPMKGLYTVLDYLQNRKIKMGIVTNSLTEFQYSKIDKLDLRKYMDTIIISEEVNTRKPDPEIFKLALSRIGSKAEDTLFVGDYPSVDIKGAYYSKIKSAWLSSDKAWEIYEYKPDYIIRELSELIKIIEYI